MQVSLLASLPHTTAEAYAQVLAACKALFEQKNKDYGTAWRILRLPSITDQIYIKAKRIRTIQEKGQQRVADKVEEEFVGIINYCLMALIQLRLPADAPLEMDYQALSTYYDTCVQETWALLDNKNHDYGEAWRDMRVSSMTDIILMKLHRLKQIEDNEGQTLVSEGAAANYQDILNYCVFCLIKLAI
ncbi:DUF1599 domain-containing protein [Eisenibacter elegans]|jgi:hypothetical protein|uniref:DUF1599 domain-containing protein n=1 Tax=Eisenibacter elegans TaxID=997 RepID=UPI000411CB32|nr:DUF1599 domain-containing protein [Eisenibacter elegans]